MPFDPRRAQLPWRTVSSPSCRMTSSSQIRCKEPTSIGFATSCKFAAYISGTLGSGNDGGFNATLSASPLTSFSIHQTRLDGRILRPDPGRGLRQHEPDLAPADLRPSHEHHARLRTDRTGPGPAPGELWVFCAVVASARSDDDGHYQRYRAHAGGVRGDCRAGGVGGAEDLGLQESGGVGCVLPDSEWLGGCGAKDDTPAG